MVKHYDLDLVGEQFGRWLVLSKVAQRAHRGVVLWLCRCSCGVERAIRAASLRNGRSTSCGCYHKEAVSLHGMYGTRTFKSWDSMLQRCLNPNSPDYPRYGGRGITIDPEWLDSFDAFHRDMGDRPAGMSIDRKDVDGPYTKDNCRWATRSQQQRNKTSTPFLEINGVRLSQADWAERSGIPSKIIGWRLAKGWTPERAVSVPVAKRTKGLN